MHTVMELRMDGCKISKMLLSLSVIICMEKVEMQMRLELHWLWERFHSCSRNMIEKTSSMSMGYDSTIEFLLPRL